MKKIFLLLIIISILFVNNDSFALSKFSDAVQVALYRNQKRLAFEVLGKADIAFIVTSDSAKRKIYKGPALNSIFYIYPINGGFRVVHKGRDYPVYNCERLMFKSWEQANVIKVNNKYKYRGWMEVRKEKKNGLLWVVNEVNIEQYIQGVLPKEVNPNWPLEALKAQAVVARNYAVKTKRKHKREDFDICTTQHCQVYGGVSFEKPSTNRAIIETKDLVITYRGKAIEGLFHSAAGLYTENSEDVWIKKIGYLRSVPANTPQFNFEKGARGVENWTKKVSFSKIEKKLKRKYKKLGYVYFMKIIQDPLKKRVRKVILGQAHGKKITVKGTTFKAYLGLYSNLFSIQDSRNGKYVKTVYNSGSNKVIMKGKGHGHGVGLSQWGAYGMAKKGYNFRQIIKHFYTKVKIEHW